MIPVDAESLELIRESATLCQRAALAKFGMTLDFDEQSVLKLDDIISSAWPTGVPSSATIQVFGSFLGEAMCETFGCKWVRTEVGLGVQLNGLVCYPLSKVEKRFVAGPNESISFFYAAFKAKACALSPDT